MADKCTEHEQCTRELYTIKQEVFGSTGTGGLRESIHNLFLIVSKLQENLLPRWAQAILTIVVMTILSASVVTWAKVESFPETYARKDSVVENKKDIEILKSKVDVVQKQLEELKSMQRTDTDRILNAIKEANSKVDTTEPKSQPKRYE